MSTEKVKTEGRRQTQRDRDPKDKRQRRRAFRVRQTRRQAGSVRRGNPEPHGSRGP